MKEENKKYLRQIAAASTIGFQVAFSIFIGLGIGVWLDSRFGTFPWLALLFMVFGIAAGFLNYYRFAVKQQKEDEKDSKKE
ncbi:AtpZ/AtpI family protein [Desulforhabdus amnigena]|jgi:ATP synthase protein I|nr:AtpZ/AtpI family protein [Desulforhabdus amnigena]NLJ27355.1 AtpZ/AtpI family protein [Deltaproteobacteria bacterium]